MFSNAAMRMNSLGGRILPRSNMTMTRFLNSTVEKNSSGKITKREKAVRCVTLTGALALSVGYALCNDEKVQCDSAEKAEKPIKGIDVPKNNDLTNQIVSIISPLFKQYGVSGFLGFCAGTAVRRVSMQAAYFIGMGFGALQLLQHTGYISVHYEKIQTDVERQLDINRDGVVDEKDLSDVVAKALNCIGSYLPDVTAFATGFASGFYFA